MDRPSWDEYFMQMAFLAAQRSTCLHHHIGAVVVKDRRIITTGYNASVSGGEECSENGYCLKEKMAKERGETAVSGKGVDDCLAIHGEENSILQGARLGKQLERF